MIATDLDGTLLRDDGSLSDRSRRALATARSRGIKVVAATGRPARVIDLVFPDCDLIDIAVCGNGTNLYVPGSGTIDILHPLPATTLNHVVETIVRLIPDAGFAIETGHRVLFEENYRFRPTLDTSRDVVTRDRLLGEPSVKLMVWLPSGEPATEWARLAPLLGELVSCTWSGTSAPFEIAAAGVSKGAALTALAAGWDIEAADVIAFGDASNDVPMLTWAGTSYAVANADLVACRAATHATASNTDDGVALVLEAALGIEDSGVVVDHP